MTPLQELQQKCGLTPDGAFGPKTFEAGYKKLGISTPIRAAHFFAQVNHETAGFKKFSENLNYTSAESLVRIFRHDYDKNRDRAISREELDFAKTFVGSPQRIANFVYANQNGNGPESSGDGWRFRGRGALQLTGRANYVLFANFMRDPEIIKNPDLVATKYAFESALFFFTRFGIWKECDKGFGTPVITKVSKMINGGVNGLQERLELTHKYAEYVK